MCPCVSILNLEIVQQQFVTVLCRQAGVSEITIYRSPVLYATIVEQAKLLSDDERYMSALQTLPEKQQTSYTAVAVLERMDTFEEDMEIQYIVKLHILDGIVFGSQGFHTFVHLFRLYRFFTTHLVRKPLVVANSKPRLAADRSVCLEYCVQMLYVWFCYLVRCMLNDIVDTTEMIDGLHDVIHRRALCRDAKRVGLKEIKRVCSFVRRLPSM